MNTLTIVIPSRNEMFLKKTVEDILTNMKGDTEIFVALDGAIADPPIPEHPKVKVLYFAESIGQRASTNELVKLSSAKYILKCDAHCSFDEGFDVKMMELMQDNFTAVPVMRNLHAFDWVCKKCGDRRYQGPTPTNCPKCDNLTEFERDIKWIGKTNPQSTSYCFDSEPHFQYFSDYKKRPEYKDQGVLTETMSLQGSCFMLTREKYWELNICDEAFGSWGSQGLEVAMKTWLSGGRVVVNHTTWYAHMFRTQGGDFGFPYSLSGRQVGRAKTMAKDIFFSNKWPLQKYPLHWLLEKFWPVPGWTEQQLVDLKKGATNTFLSISSEIIPQESTIQTITPTIKEILPNQPTKGIVYYTDNLLEDKLAKQVQRYIQEAGLPIISISLQPINFGKNAVVPLERSYLTMFKQILIGLELLQTDIVFLCEHDVIYAQEHFNFTPEKTDLYYYNINNWQVRRTDGHAVYWVCQKLSQICAYRTLLLEHYRERVRRVELEGFSRAMGFEPGTHRRKERVDDYGMEHFKTIVPNLDIRHEHNLTHSRWKASQFRNPCIDWTETHVNKLVGWEGLVL